MWMIEKSEMRTQSADTDGRTEAVLIALLRSAEPSKKFAQTRSLSQTVASLSRRAIARRNQQLSEDELGRLFVRYHYGEELADRLEGHLKRQSDERP